MPRLARLMMTVVLSVFTGACPSSSDNVTDDTSDEGGEPGTEPPAIVFEAVGSSFGSFELIDIEFLPGQNGEALVLAKNGTIYYMTKNYAPLADTESITVAGEGEQGLLNVAADPDYQNNRFVYFYYTLSDESANAVDRMTVSVDVDAGSFSLSDRQRIITFSKSDSASPDSNHNGGGLFFDDGANLFAAVGDGGGSSSSDTGEAVSQNLGIRLGKILRFVPDRTMGSGGFAIPGGGNNEPAGALGEIYAYGLRNPFTITHEAGALFIGDVGGSLFEEIDLAQNGGLNFGWPLSEGETTDSGVTSPLHGYAHSDDTFINEDSQIGEEESAGAIMVLHLYTGDQYDGGLDRRLIYTDFYLGWVRGLQLDDDFNVTDDDHLGHQAGLTSLQEGPDGFLYGVSLGGADQILRLDVDE